jgi:prepilin-type N-terminal cleavage/methylation domain-containing protein
MKKCNQGFTLAEVLLTLAIIGVVAALTIPALLSATYQAEFKAGYKKSLSTANGALKRFIAENSIDASGLITTTADDAGNKSLSSAFRSAFNLISEDTTTGQLTTADGMIWDFQRLNAGACNVSNDLDTANCIVIVDVNGNKGPNDLSSGTAGTGYIIKDQFKMIIQPQMVIPANSTTNTSETYVFSNF